MPGSQILSINAAAPRSDMDSQAMYISEAQDAINSHERIALRPEVGNMLRIVAYEPRNAGKFQLRACVR